MKNSESFKEFKKLNSDQINEKINQLLTLSKSQSASKTTSA